MLVGHRYTFDIFLSSEGSEVQTSLHTDPEFVTCPSCLEYTNTELRNQALSAGSYGACGHFVTTSITYNISQYISCNYEYLQHSKMHMGLRQKYRRSPLIGYD